MTKPRTSDIIIGIGFLAVGLWSLSNGDAVVGVGLAIVGVLALAAGFVPRVHDLMYRPLWSRSKK